MSKNTKNATKKAQGDLLSIKKSQASQTRKDMSTWRKAKAEATKPEFPRRARLVELAEDMLLDTHLSSQVELRVATSLMEKWQLVKASGEVDEETTELLQKSIAWGELLQHIYETPFWGHSLVEFLPSENDLFTTSLIPRQHVVPGLGLVLREVKDTEGIEYRNLVEYGASIVEFGSNDDLGIIFECAPIAIYRRYALSAWSEFVEIYGIPPRVLKIDTLDNESFERAKKMMQEMGSANWAIVDVTEDLTFGTGVADNGELFYSLIRAAKEEISLKICGVVLGQDTKHGNRSKEESSKELFEAKCLFDRRTATKIINNTILPALAQLDVIPADLTFLYPADEEEDNSELWNRTIQLLPYYDIPAEFIKEQFGIDVTERKTALGGAELSAKLKGGESDFFG